MRTTPTRTRLDPLAVAPVETAVVRARGFVKPLLGVRLMRRRLIR